jgi:large subunit ribosomal protein L23
MGLFDRFNKPKSEKKKYVDKKKKQREEDLKKKQFMAVSGAPMPEKEIPKKVGGEPRKKEEVKKPRKEDTKNAYKVLLKPIISEKATALGASNQYVFMVAMLANKIEIKKAVKNLYGISPRKVNIINQSGKKVRYGQTEGKTKNWKKAVVILHQGDKIDFYGT